MQPPCFPVTTFLYDEQYGGIAISHENYFVVKIEGLGCGSQNKLTLGIIM